MGKWFGGKKESKEEEDIVVTKEENKEVEYKEGEEDKTPLFRLVWD